MPFFPRHPVGQPTPFVREGEGQASLTTVRPDTGQLGRARDWKLLADLGKKLCFPGEIAATDLRPDIVLWSASLKLVYIVELTVPWEGAVEERTEEAEVRWTCSRCATTRLECDATPSGSRLQRVGSHLNIQATQRDGSAREGPPAGGLSRAAEKGSQWLWMKRKDSSWAFK